MILKSQPSVIKVKELEDFKTEISLLQADERNPVPQQKNKWLVRSINGHDIFWLDTFEIDLQDLGSSLDFLQRLFVEDSQNCEVCKFEDFENLGLQDFSLVTNNIIKTTDGQIVTSQQWLAMIYVVENFTFTHDWKKWLNTPIKVLSAMIEIIKEYPRPSL